MNILFITHFFVGFIVSDIYRVSIFGHCPYSVTFPYNNLHKIFSTIQFWIFGIFFMNILISLIYFN